MPKIRSAKKRMRQNAPRRGRNRHQMAALRTAMRKVETAESSADAAQAYRAAEALLDRAAGKRLLHPNTAARQKARLARTARTR